MTPSPDISPGAIKRLCERLREDQYRLDMTLDENVNVGKSPFLCGIAAVIEALAAPRASAGFAEGIEAAAKWHDRRRMLLEGHRARLRSPAEIHTNCAAAIRTLAVSPAPNGWDREASKARIRATAEALMKDNTASQAMDGDQPNPSTHGTAPDAKVAGDAVVHVPSGWRLVPLIQTAEMAMAAYAAFDAFGEDAVLGPHEVIAIYNAMLAAAPTPPAGEAWVEKVQS